jgi:hypothetical protein
MDNLGRPVPSDPNNPNRPATVPSPALAGQVSGVAYDRNAVKASITENNASPIGALLVGVDEFLSGEPVKVKVNAGNGLTFTAKNELGTEYQFTATGQFDLDGKVVSSS